MKLGVLLSLFVLPAASAGPEARWSLGSFTSSEAERFLREAKPIHRAELPTGVTESDVLTLRDGSREARAVWKTLDEYAPMRRFSDGKVEIDYRDSWESEVAAYEIDKLLGLHMVPPTVERRIRGDHGSLQLWLEGCVTEAERRKDRRAAPDMEKFNRQMLTARLFHQLIKDTDYKNARNLLVDGRFRLYLIDSSRAFRTNPGLLKAEYLTRFSRALIARLRDLNLELLKERVGRWLSDSQIEALLRRRDLILERASELVAREGEAAVLYP